MESANIDPYNNVEQEYKLFCRCEDDDDDEGLPIKHVTKMPNLSSVLFVYGGDAASIATALRKATGAYWSQTMCLQSRSASRSLRFKHYLKFVVPILLHGCQTWTCCRKLHNRFQIWENNMLRKMMPIKNIEDEAWQMFFRRHSRYVRNMFMTESYMSMSERVLRAIL